MSTLPPYFAANAQLAPELHSQQTRRRYGSTARLRLRVYGPDQNSSEAAISRLRSEYGLLVNLAQALPPSPQAQSCFDLELSGTIAQLQKGLAYLQTLNVVIKGKPNVDGDSWYH